MGQVSSTGVEQIESLYGVLYRHNCTRKVMHGIDETVYTMCCIDKTALVRCQDDKCVCTVCCADLSPKHHKTKKKSILHTAWTALLQGVVKLTNESLCSERHKHVK